MATNTEDEEDSGLSEDVTFAGDRIDSKGRRTAVAPSETSNEAVALLQGDEAQAAGERIGLILDIPVQVTVELGRTKLPIRSLLQLGQGSVVELDGLAGEPMDVLVNGCLIAQGEVVVVNEKFGIRLTDIVTPAERLRRLSIK